MMTQDILFGVDGIGYENLDLENFEEDNELDVQKYLQRALADHVEGKNKIFCNPWSPMTKKSFTGQMCPIFKMTISLKYTIRKI